MNRRHPHAAMLEEMLLNKYDVSFKRMSINCITRIGNQIKYQVISESGDVSELHDTIGKAVDSFLLHLNKKYKV